MRNKQDASGGDNSTVNQAGGDLSVTTTNNYGLSYSDAKGIAMDVFNSNFIELGIDVEKLINERANRIITEYLDRLVEEDPDLIQKTNSPDIRYGIYEAQKNYARFGNEDMGNLLVDLLIERTKSEDETLTTLVLNETLNIIPKITNKQIKMLTLIFVIRYLNFNPGLNIPFILYYFEYVRHISDNLPSYKNDIDFIHLEYSGCLSISIGSVSFESIMKNKNLLDASNEEDYKNLLLNNQFFKDLENIWDNTQMKNCSLSTVGIAIALTNLNRYRKDKLPIDKWMTE
jgi:hypothetical protein